ncbi:hypothetical protein LO772_01575 [Yinghuangia sp. ASG 101]|uniref:hypothetical protein n=1 Tax=Yinghuangia sp. ASG 101 TaxID=2896848 RepID=UPI001E5451D0|nr:hypothetical protein [Yinghuangia sp. ASG 101]UGQ12329.1 hypothetical protein LO772_01575 [Yinghuangia sp. ASG 101]
MTHEPPAAPGRTRGAAIREWAAGNKVKAGVVVGVAVLVILGIVGAVAGSVSGSGSGSDKADGTAAGASVSSAAGTPGAPTGSSAADPSGPTGADPAASASAEAPSAPVPSRAAAPVLPLFVGQGLQTAQDTAQAAGYFHLASTDALGRDRMQILGREWQVCFQDPAPGPVAEDATITFGVVRVDETCPANPVPVETTSADQGDPVPNVVGKSANVARDAFPRSASVSVRDVSGTGRMVLVRSNWLVCGQTPAPGTPYTGQPVTLDVVKFGETCP